MSGHRTEDSGHMVVTQTDTFLPAFWGGRQAIGRHINTELWQAL